MALPRIGMRTVKTAVAVMACYLLFLPITAHPVLSQYVNGPFYACIAAVICTQESVRKSWDQGVSRLIGTLLGGALGLAGLELAASRKDSVWFALLLGGGVVLLIWLCNAIGRPSACSIACIVLCVVLLNHPGDERYLFTLARVGETALGILVAVLVNHLLPGHRGGEGSLS